MCLDFNGNKVQVCTVGDLLPGQRYRDPDGEEYLITDGTYPVVNLRTGEVASTLDWIGTGFRKDIKLGTDRAGRLYASRYLNPATKPVEEQPDNLGFDQHGNAVQDNADTQDPADIMRDNNPS